MTDLVRVIIPLSFQNKRNEEFGLEFIANLSSWKENYLMMNNKILNNFGQTWEICSKFTSRVDQDLVLRGCPTVFSETRIFGALLPQDATRS